MSETNEYYFMKYVDGLTKDAQAEGEAREREANLRKLEKILENKGYSPAEAKSFLREYSTLK